MQFACIESVIVKLVTEFQLVPLAKVSNESRVDPAADCPANHDMTISLTDHNPKRYCAGRAAPVGRTWISLAQSPSCTTAAANNTAHVRKHLAVCFCVVRARI